MIIIMMTTQLNVLVSSSAAEHDSLLGLWDKQDTVKKFTSEPFSHLGSCDETHGQQWVKKVQLPLWVKYLRRSTIWF